MLEINPERQLLVGMVLERIARDMMGEDVPEEFIEWLERTPDDILLELIPSDHPLVSGGTGKSSRQCNIFDLPSLTDIMDDDPNYFNKSPMFNCFN